MVNIAAMVLGSGLLSVNPGLVSGWVFSEANEKSESALIEKADSDELGEVEELEIEEFEEIEELDVAGGEPDSFGDFEKSVSWAEVAGYFHSASTHFPIGGLWLLFILELFALAPAFRHMSYASMIGAPLVALSFGPGIITGLQRLRVLGLTGHDLEHALKHRNLAFICAGLVFAATAVLLSNRKQDRMRHYIYLGLLGAAALLSVAVGHEGGEMVYGEPPWNDD